MNQLIRKAGLCVLVGLITCSVARAQDIAAYSNRKVFSGFVDAVTARVDPNSGGAPQLGCIYRTGPGRLLGIIHDSQRYFAGAHLIGDEALDGVEWRNALFERADGHTKRRLPGAQPQPRQVAP